MQNEILLAIVTKMVDEKLSQLPVATGHRGPRGPLGLPGKDFDIGEHEELINGWIKDAALKFSDLTSDEIASLKGQDGGRGPRGYDGKSFLFGENEEAITDIIAKSVEGLSDSLKLKFSDLDAEEISQLRGPQGRKGEAGKDFIFEEHEKFFKSLKLKFTDLSEDERDSLKLKFESLTEQERDSLKMKFSDLSEEDRLLIKGARGQRGKHGTQGIQGERGETGLQGTQGFSIPGLPGPRGPTGLAGRQGLDGKDAPAIIDVEVIQTKEDFEIIFHFDDGASRATGPIQFPVSPDHTVYVVGGGFTSGGGGGGGSPTTLNDLTDATINLPTVNDLLSYNGTQWINSSIEDLLMKQYTLLLDEVTPTLSYIGEALPGTSPSAITWRIKILDESSDPEVQIKWASGTASFDKRWNDRATYIYS